MGSDPVSLPFAAGRFRFITYAHTHPVAGDGAGGSIQRGPARAAAVAAGAEERAAAAGRVQRHRREWRRGALHCIGSVLICLLKLAPPALLPFCTSSLQLATTLPLPSLPLQLDIAVAELPDLEVPLKRLLLLLDLARQGQPEEERVVSLTRWSQVLRDLNG